MSRYLLLQHIMEEAASKFPDKPAISIRKERITYKELLEKSCCLAGKLTSIGFKPGDTAGIYLNKSIEAIVAMFGILKAGGAYIPLDSHYSPLNRIKNIIRLSETKFLVSSPKHWEQMLAGAAEQECGFLEEIKVIFLQNEESMIESSHNIFYYDEPASCGISADIAVTRDDIAYILYTSGSTGVPKGVMLTHLNALNFIEWALDYFKPTHDDVFSNFAPLHFDLSVFDIYVSIACGGCLNLVPFEISGNPKALVEWIVKNNISFMYSVPSLWVSILNYADIRQEAFKTLKNILFAGEVFPPRYLKKLMELLPHAAYYNLYGPTETNVCTAYHVKSSGEIAGKPVPIGGACANAEILVLNERDKPVSIGEEGELYVKGDCVTKGYFKDPERTKSAFRKSPMDCHSGAMLYSTGDIVRCCKENIYEYVGRKDLMIKCSGFRIELPEIEHALYKNDGIEEAAAVAVLRSEGEGMMICVAVKMKDGKRFSVIGIKNFLADILPKYMIPEIIKNVNEIPRNANGKVDRQKVNLWLANE